MPFRSRPDQPRDLLAQIDAEVRERIQEAVDLVALDVMVQDRRARHLPAPRADSVRDREEFDAGARRFLGRLEAELVPAVSGEAQRTLARVAAEAGPDEIDRRLAVQVALARTLPDYWQRFEAVRTAYTAERLGSRRGPRPGVLGRLLGG